MKWEREALGQICSTSSGGTPNRKNKTFYVNGVVPWVKSGELRNNTIYFSEELITEEALKNSSAKVFPKGTLLIAMYGATIGKLAFLGIDAATNQAVCGIFKNPKVLLKYLYFYLLFQRPNLIKRGIGDAQPNISQTILKQLYVSYPAEIREQERIVARIEELFSELDKAVETLNTTKQQLAVYRQAVLKEAFKHSVAQKQIRDISILVTSGSRGWAKYYADSGARFIRITDLTRNTIQLKNNSIQYVDLPELAEGKRSKLEKDDILVSITADLGSIALIPDHLGEAYINQHIAMIRLKNTTQSEYIAWYLKSDLGQKELLKNKRGGGKLGLGLDDIRNTHVPVVEDDMALNVVEKIDRQLSVCDQIEKTIEQSLQQAEALRQSILKQAFEGRL